MAGQQQQQQLPDWVREQNLKHDEAERQKAEKLQREFDNSKFVTEHGPQFWKQLTDAIHRNANALEHLKGESLWGVSSLATAGGSSKQQTCHVQVNCTRLNNPFFMRLFYTEGATQITRYYGDNESRPIYLSRKADLIAGDEGSGPLNAEKLGETLVRDMAKKAKTSIRI